MRIFTYLITTLLLCTQAHAQLVGKKSFNSNSHPRSSSEVRVFKDRYIINPDRQARFQVNQSLAALGTKRGRFEVIGQQKNFSLVSPQSVTASSTSFKISKHSETPNLCAEILQEFPGYKCTPDYVLQTAADVLLEPNDYWYYPHPERAGDPNVAELTVGQQKDYQAIGAPNAWGGGNQGNCSNPSIVGVIDSGVNYLHPDLKWNMWNNSREASGVTGVDDDRNGYVDDIYGINLTNNGRAQSDPMDDNGHGSHVSGIIGARGNDNLGTAGVNWCVKIVAMKIFPETNQAALSNAIEALDYLTELKTKQGYKVAISNNSWGVPDPGDDIPALKDAIARSNDAGIMFVAAAMNNAQSLDTNPWYPASYEGEGILTVAATDSSTGAIASFSNYGSTVDIAAPGYAVVSTTIGPDPNGAYYNSYYGTSMATPFIVGAIAMYQAKYPSSSIATLRNQLLTKASTQSNLTSKVAGGKYVSLKAMFPQPTATPTRTKTPPSTSTATGTATAGSTKTPAPTATPTPPPEATKTQVPLPTATATFTFTATKTPVPSITKVVSTPSPTHTPIKTPTATATKAVTPSATKTRAVDPSPTQTPITRKTATSTASATSTATRTATATSTKTATATGTKTTTPTPTTTIATLKMIAHPINTIAKEGMVTYFACKASGGSAPILYNWQRKLAGEQTFSDLFEQNSALDEYVFTATANLNLASYRCRASDSKGRTILSESAVLTVVAITATPTRTRTATPTRSATPSPSRTIAPPPYTPSSTATASPSKTATSTPTSTKSPSPSPSLTPSPTSSATSSATPTATPTPQPSTADFLVSSANELSAYRFDGSLIASIDIPFGQPDRTDTNSARDVIVLPTGDIALFNGGGSPFLSILEQTSGSWQHFQLPGWNTIKTSGSGGIVADGQSIYLTDMPQAGQGLLSLSLKDKTFKRFAQNIAPTDLAIAGDQLYALVNRKNLLVYDTNTLELQNVIRLRRRVRAFALRKSGSIYGVAERGSAIYNFSPTGRLMQVRKLGQGALIDINVSIEDLVLVGAKNGSVILSDPSLKSFAPFTVSDVPAYVEFTN